MRRQLATPWRAPAPVICVGNASVGGVGKTPFALMLGQMLIDAGYAPQFLSRGYGRRTKETMRVNPDTHHAVDVGDEPLLLAGLAPTWVSRTKRRGAEAMVASGADIIIMDDGFQNPTIEKDFSILLIDDRQRRSNGMIFPAGPMRERLEDAQKRADAIVEVTTKPGVETAEAAVNFTAWLEAAPATEGRRVLAFCGIANPRRFFDMLEAHDFELADTVAFPDHYQFTKKNIDSLAARARKLNAELMTTEKDWVRISRDQRDAVKTLPVRMRASDPEGLTSSVLAAVEKHRGN